LVRFSMDVVRSMQSEAKGKSSRLDRTFSVSLKQLVALLLFVIVVSAVGFWAVQRVDVYDRWRSQFEISQSLRTHLDKAYVLLISSNFETDSITQNWFYSEVQYAIHSVGDLLELDGGHSSQLGRIQFMLEDLRDPTQISRLIGLNSTDRTALAEALHGIGWKAVAAYTNYFEPAGSSNPPLWYLGPSPPDEKILEEAVELAIDIEENLLP
jgi:hypothetical protein